MNNNLLSLIMAQGCTIYLVCGCRLVFGELPSSDIGFVTHKLSKKAYCDTALAAQIGASIVIGTPKNLKKLKINLNQQSLQKTHNSEIQEKPVSTNNIDANEKAVLDRVKQFFDQFGNTRFENTGNVGKNPFPNRAGFVRPYLNNGQKYLVLPNVFRDEFCCGFERKFFLSVLDKHGLINVRRDLPTNGNRHTQRVRVRNFGVRRFYVLDWPGKA